jgi:hypothetical protein
MPQRPTFVSSEETENQNGDVTPLPAGSTRRIRCPTTLLAAAAAIWTARRA